MVAERFFDREKEDMKSKEEQLRESIERINEMEQILDRADRALKRLEDATEELESMSPDIRKLEKYYTGRNWKKDLKLDEKGALPEELKRGVLSEDAVNDLLDRLKEVKAGIKV